MRRCDFCGAQPRDMRLDRRARLKMDRNCPEISRYGKSGYAESKALIERWMARTACNMRSHRASHPPPRLNSWRLPVAGAEHPDVYVHHAHRRKREEVAWVAELSSGTRSYLDVTTTRPVYAGAQVLAHGICSMIRLRCLHKRALPGSLPTSTSRWAPDWFDLQRTSAAGVRVGVGTDVGGGDEFPACCACWMGLQSGAAAPSQSFGAEPRFNLATFGRRPRARSR